MRKLDYLLVVAITVSPMNTLRFGQVGPAEIALLLWCVGACLNAKYPLDTGALGKAWIAFFCILVASTLHGVVVTPESTHPTGLITWAFLGLTCVITYAVVQGRSRAQAESLLSAVGTVSTLWFASLYVYSVLVAMTIFDVPLWYGGGLRFSGGGDNPHQLAVLMAACTFINVRGLLRARGFGRGLWSLLLTAGALFLGYETLSSTLFLAIAVTGAVTLFCVLLDRFPSRSSRTAITTLAAMLLVIVAVLQWSRLVGLAEAFIDNDPNGRGRLTLWATFNDILGHVVLLGLGPGTHAEDGRMEFHNSYLELAAMIGLPATVAALVAMIMAVRRLSREWTLMAIVLPLFVYALPGFAFRRPSFWLILAICLALTTILARGTTDAVAGDQLATPTHRRRRRPGSRVGSGSAPR